MQQATCGFFLDGLKLPPLLSALGRAAGRYRPACGRATLDTLEPNNYTKVMERRNVGAIRAAVQQHPAEKKTQTAIQMKKKKYASFFFILTCRPGCSKHHGNWDRGVI